MLPGVWDGLDRTAELSSGPRSAAPALTAPTPLGEPLARSDGQRAVPSPSWFS